jgi:hypothetical protein
MASKFYIYISFIFLFLNGCSYKLVSTEQLDSIDARLVSLEQKIVDNISKELDVKLDKQDKDVQSCFEKSRIEQNEILQSLNNQLATLIKVENSAKAQRKKRTKVVNKVVQTDEKKLVVGSVEKVHIYPSNLVMNARIDTGAETSSIHADDITKFERDGKRWVRFTLFDEKTKTPHTIERKVVRGVRIIQSSLEEGYERRVVVKLKVTIGDKKELSEFTLTSREHMTYPILIGRNVLQDLIIVDVSEKYIAPLIAEDEKKFQK